MGEGALGLACGARLPLHNSLPWNDLATSYFGYDEEIDTLRSRWRVTDRAGFTEVPADLHGARFGGWKETPALTARAELAGRLGREPSPGEWQRAVGQVLDRRRADAGLRAEVHGLVPRIAGYEAAFRRDGVLGAEQRVDSLAAFDYGRVISLVRLGLGARLCDPGRAEEAVLAAGRLSRAAYGSWQSFSAAYALTRVLVNWTPPTPIERELYEAGLRGDTAAQLRVPAGEELYVGQHRHEVDADPDRITWHTQRDPAGDRLYRPLLTRGMLPPWHRRAQLRRGHPARPRRVAAGGRGDGRTGPPDHPVRGPVPGRRTAASRRLGQHGRRL
ncbi:DUF1266 domain-containing protein [Streptomyces sp. NPDC047097]|uniref:DUF1266 domain-containing protein n=1 Tax=Streptomyces sp. NPDC047097 TaxID=3155260 RepID=UPI0033ED4DF1